MSGTTGKRLRLRRLTQTDVIGLLKSGVYSVCPKSGTVTGPKGIVKPVKFKDSYGRLWVRLYGDGGVKSIARARLVWISVAGIPVPPGFEVHHKDERNDNDSWDNLICIYRLDHKKLHYGRDDEQIPF